jgi:phage recombination protein Bet
MSTTTPATAQKENERGLVSYQVAGEDVKLSYQIVRDFLTKGGGNVSDQDLTLFISMCKFNQLNPFLNEAYLVKYGTSPASMIVSKEALLKRAEACDNYDGIQAGVIVMREGQAVELEGCFYLPTDTLVGGWAKVYRTDKKFPYVSKVRMQEYDKGQSTWKEKPSTMIRKVAEVQALREAFPTQLGAMYTADEQGIKDIDFEYVNDRKAIALDVKDQPDPMEQAAAAPETAQKSKLKLEDL